MERCREVTEVAGGVSTGGQDTWNQSGGRNKR